MNTSVILESPFLEPWNGYQACNSTADCVNEEGELYPSFLCRKTLFISKYGAGCVCDPQRTRVGQKCTTNTWFTYVILAINCIIFIQSFRMLVGLPRIIRAVKSRPVTMNIPSMLRHIKSMAFNTTVVQVLILNTWGLMMVLRIPFSDAFILDKITFSFCLPATKVLIVFGTSGTVLGWLGIIEMAGYMPNFIFILKTCFIIFTCFGSTLVLLLVLDNDPRTSHILMIVLFISASATLQLVKYWISRNFAKVGSGNNGTVFTTGVNYSSGIEQPSVAHNNKYSKVFTTKAQNSADESFSNDESISSEENIGTCVESVATKQHYLQELNTSANFEPRSLMKPEPKTSPTNSNSRLKKSLSTKSQFLEPASMKVQDAKKLEELEFNSSMVVESTDLISSLRKARKTLSMKTAALIQYTAAAERIAGKRKHTLERTLERTSLITYTSFLVALGSIAAILDQRMPLVYGPDAVFHLDAFIPVILYATYTKHTMTLLIYMKPLKPSRK